MRIRWCRRRAARTEAALPEGAHEAREAVAAARRAGSEAARRTPEATALAETLKNMREANHFSERVAAMIQGGGRG